MGSASAYPLCLEGEVQAGNIYIYIYIDSRVVGSGLACIEGNRLESQREELR